MMDNRLTRSKHEIPIIWGSMGVLIGVLILALGACSSDADVARKNLDLAAEQFEVERRIVFINGITDEYLLEVVGRCSYEPEAEQVVLICKTADDEFWKHTMIRSDNVTAVIEQVSSADVDVYRHRVVFRPEEIVPNVDLETSLNEDDEG